MTGIIDYFRTNKFNNEHIHVKNFGRVNKFLFRGALPDEHGYKDLAKSGVRQVVNLIEGLDFDTETDKAHKAGIALFVHFPMRDDKAPDEELVKRTIQLLRDNVGAKIKTYFGCKGNRDRGSLVAAVYRVVVDGWTKEMAWEEAKMFGAIRGRRVLGLFGANHAPLWGWFFDKFNPGDFR